MIAQLSGTLLFKSPQYLIVDVQGVGYRVLVSLTSFAALPEVGSAVTIHTHTHLREDQLVLFGFTSLEEKSLFQRLISISGVGPKIALTILSGIPARELIDAISQENSSRLQSIPGVGKKTAERIIIELKDKLIKEFPRSQLQAAPGSSSRFYDDVLSALMNLGYQRSQAEKAMQRIPWNEVETIQNAIRRTLKELAKP
jgi:Holliday junction DNA helicase RuvA